MASTIANYQGNGSTTDFNVPFDYLAKKFVKVTVDSREKLGGDYGDTAKDYFFVDKTTIRFNTAPASGTEIIIRRYTSSTDRIVSFKDASVLKAKDLDVSTIQTIHIAEEGRDIINDALIVNKEGNWDAKGKRIINVGDPIDDNDAITLKVYKDDAKGAYQAKLSAEAARDAAKVSETNAKASEVNAKESEVTAKASAGTSVSAAKYADAVKTESQAVVEEARQIQTNVETSERNVYENAIIATQKAEEAKVSETNAKVSETNAKASEVSASESASLAKAQVALAVQEVTKAKEQVSLATQQAALAITKATEAEDSATSASQSATAASASAKNASASASTATTQATNASNSAKAAKLSEDNAALSKTAAGTSEANAKASEVEAKKQADLAKDYANQASNGQINADWNETVSTSKAFIKNKPTLGALASKDSITYSEITGTPPEQDLSGLATKNELQTGLAGKADTKHTHTVAEVTDLNSTLSGYVTTDTLTAELDKKQGKGDYATNTALTQGLAGKANSSHTHTVSQITDMPKAVLSVNDITPDDSGNVKISALPLGHLFAWPFQTPPDGTIQCNGETYSRDLYKDFFAYATSKGWVKTESEWQSISSTDNGYCPYFSQGDGSTTFRTPRFAPFMQLTFASEYVGDYLRAGLPNIKGTFTEHGNTAGLVCTGAFEGEKRIGLGSNSGGASDGGRVTMDGSRSSSIYGRSSTVQPEANKWMICVVVAGQATNLGSVDVSNVMSAVAQVQAQMNKLSGVAGDVTKLKRFFNGTFTKTLLAGGPLKSDCITSGNITLVKPWDNFDALLIYSGTDSSDSYLNRTLIYKWQLSELLAIAKTSGKNYVQTWNNVSGHYWGVKVTSSTSIAFKDPEENSSLQAIYGLKC